MFSNKKKNITLRFVLVVFVLSVFLSCGGSKVPDITSSWELIKEIKVKQPVRLAAFYNEDFGVTGGYSGNGKTHYTTDGGVTWTKSEQSGGCIYGVDVINEDLVWVAGRKTGQSFTTPGGVRLSANGGLDWLEPTEFPFTPREAPMSFINENTGWVYQSDTFCKTTDGGRKISEIQLPEGVTEVRSVKILDPDTGFIIDSSGKFHFTKDSGDSWTSHDLLTGYFENMKLINIESVASAIYFSDTQKGMVVINLQNREGKKIYILRTSDGGRKWMSEILMNGGGSVHISHDGNYITVKASKIKLYKNLGA